jgi:hypothetical protein
MRRRRWKFTVAIEALALLKPPAQPSRAVRGGRTAVGGVVSRAMAQDSEQLERLARELAELDAKDRARVLADAGRLKKSAGGPRKFEIPTLRGGTAWIGGDSRRENLYGDDGR